MRSILIYVLLAFLCHSPITDAWSVLVLGGSGFKGHYTTELLARSGHEVTVLSRGKTYWGVLKKLQGLGVQHWACNRTIDVDPKEGPRPGTSGLAACPQLIDTSEIAKSFDVVVDFSTKTLEQLKQAIRLLKGRVKFYIFLSTHAVYDVSKNTTHQEPMLYESDAQRPGKEVSPLERFQLKEKNLKGNELLECEEELMKNFNSGGFPFATLRTANVFGPRENTFRYLLLHLWIRAHLALRLPLHLDETMLETPISMTYTPDIAQAVARIIAKAMGDVCCEEDVHGEAFNLACEEAPNQWSLYNYIAEPMGLNYVETVEMSHNKSIVLYPEIVRGPLNTQKALEVLKWAPTDLQKAARSVARFYDRVMLDESKYKWERELMYGKFKKMLIDDGPRFVSWIRNFYDEKRKTELYDELDDEDEDEIILYRPSPRHKNKNKGKKGKGKETSRKKRKPASSEL